MACCAQHAYAPQPVGEACKRACSPAIMPSVVQRRGTVNWQHECSRILCAVCAWGCPDEHALSPADPRSRPKVHVFTVPAHLHAGLRKELCASSCSTHGLRPPPLPGQIRSQLRLCCKTFCALCAGVGTWDRLPSSPQNSLGCPTCQEQQYHC